MTAYELTVEVAKLQTSIEKNEEHVNQRLLRVNDDLNELKYRLVDFEKRQHELDKRISVLEKGSDFSWRLAPVVLSAIAILVSLVVAFVKK